MSASALDQRLQTVGELLPFDTTQLHFAHELLKSRGAVGLALDVMHNGLIGQHELGHRSLG